MKGSPSVLRNNKSIEIAVFPYATSNICLHDIDFILDFNPFNEIIGIEIINIKEELGLHCLELFEKMNFWDNAITYSYDGDTDSFYLRITDERSIDQKVVNGEILLNDKRQIVAMKASS
jgi:uncharacterized protein YuzE